MSSLAQRWLDEGKAEGIQIGMQTGVFETAIVMIKDFQIAIDDVVLKLNRPFKKQVQLKFNKKRG